MPNPNPANPYVSSAKRHPAASAKQDMGEELIALMRVLQGLVQIHESLAETIDHKRLALREGNTHAVVAACQVENEAVQKIAELEKKRLHLVGALTLQLNPQAKAPMRLVELAMKLPAEPRERILALRETLRERMKQVRQQTHVTRRATEKLVNHMQGLLQNVTSLAQGSHYASSGRTDAKPAALSTFSALA